MTARREAGPDALTFTERGRRQQLIEATIDLISTRGYPATSLSAIAERAGLSKAAVLYHFSSKDNLTRAALEQVMEQFRAHVGERVARAAGPRDAIVAYVRAMIGYQQAHRRQVRVITEMLLDDEGGTRLKTPGSHDTHGRWQALATLLTEGQEAGVFRKFDVRVVALAIGGAIDGVIAHWLVHPDLDLDAAAAELEGFALSAIEPRA
ncbi:MULTISPECIES: TetR/AcrR family transcriptional regulator [unclassified Streptomyces]|uniref:TetR/AcrR family transcriptional regulator n=1 Tax=unclassified Streptomyces TaxID=2593676 RepID=UPI000890A90A|nr:MULTISPECIES: TetR/AcrR family transcriptional regulator [unclassified Streptomyces]PBC86707.1 TetR family transcriptional regulator [Streptomyces sp. 2321.6]SDQ75031.1 transcriptional regulator, TetR family [Streptomyces sp. KS_16]SED49014.1 transcriptional regulator, TetR family [Streptomyces sp. 2112.3]SEE06956.1 transcriptional regulator, TetR family [Streptomyces sp. 2133.1]SNC73883.1 DNA-binding transcriptional regulator, AcrR family [Streptomyces sp. 2114.4]